MIDASFTPAQFGGVFACEAPRAGNAWDCSGPGYRIRCEGLQVHADAHSIVLVAGAPRWTDGRAESVASGFAALYATRGPQAIDALRGPYALVLLEARRRAALLFSDRFATHSLCFSVQGDTLHFSDRADTLGRRLNCAVDEQALFDYLYFHVIPAPRTAFRGVRRLDLASFVRFGTDGLHTAPHWRPQFVEDDKRPFAELKEEFLGLIDGAVRREAAGQSTGCFLSGGTDSSTVAGMLTRVGGKPAESFSIGFDAEGYDEMEYARIAARHFGCAHHEHYLTRAELLRNIPLVAAAYDQPFGNSSAGAAYQCALVAKEHGVEKLLAGDGGDELFGGNTRYAKQKIFGVYEILPAFVRRYGMEKLPLFGKAASYVEQARVPMPDRMNMYNLLLRLGIDAVLEPQFLAQVDANAPIVQQREVYAASQGAALINRMLAFDWKYTLADNDLPKVCGTVHLAGLEVGFPLLSDELLDFSLRLLPALKLKGLKLRYFFKEALRGFLPDAIITKKKHGFGLPFGAWAMDDPGLRALAFDSLSRLRGRGIVRAQFIDQLQQELLPQHPGYYGEMLWILLMLEQWFAAQGKLRG